MRLKTRSGLLLALLFACSSSNPSRTDGAAGAAGSDAAAALAGGPDGEAGRDDVGAGGGAGGDAPVDARAQSAGGSGCNSGWPETGPVVKSRCGSDLAIGGGTILDGRYQLTSFSLLDGCGPATLPPSVSRAFTVAGNIWTGVDGMADATGVITGWQHWRATVSTNGILISASYQCGTSELGNSYSVVDDGLILIARRGGPQGLIYRFKRL